MPGSYNPPPNWPAPPAGWVPPAGWQPDLAWGPPPPGWNLWSRANRHPFLVTLACQAVLYPVVVVAFGLATGTSPEELGYLTGTLLLASVFVLPGVGLAARNAPRRWPWWVFALVVLLASTLVASGLVSLGQLGSAGSASDG